MIKNDHFDKLHTDSAHQWPVKRGYTVISCESVRRCCIENISSFEQGADCVQCNARLLDHVYGKCVYGPGHLVLHARFKGQYTAAFVKMLRDYLNQLDPR